MQQFAYFLEKLKTEMDGDTPLLDRTMVLFGSGMSYGHSHSNSNLSILLAGGRGLGLKHGQHIDHNQPQGGSCKLDYDEWRSLCGKPKDEKARLSYLMLTMMQKMEVHAERFVDSLGPVSEIVAYRPPGGFAAGCKTESGTAVSQAVVEMRKLCALAALALARRLPAGRRGFKTTTNRPAGPESL